MLHAAISIKVFVKLMTQFDSTVRLDRVPIAILAALAVGIGDKKIIYSQT